MTPFRILILVLSFTVASPNVGSEDENPVLELHVSPQGLDTNDGTTTSPFLTLEKARDALREARQAATLSAGPCVVNLHPGTYQRRQSFQLTSADTGTVESPIIFRASGEGEVTLSGGLSLSPNDLTKVSDPAILELLPAASRDRVHLLKLANIGVEMEEFGNIQYWQKGGLTYPVGPSVILIDGQKLTLARYPKADEGPEKDGFVFTGKVAHTGSIPRHSQKKEPAGGIFHYTDPRVAAWSDHKNIWLYGYLKETYADGTVQIKSIDREAGTLSLVQPSWYGVGEKGRYFYQNILEELTLPGEYVIDPEQGVIYLIPPDGFNSGSTIELSLSSEPLIENKGANHITFSGVNCRLTRSDAIRVEDAGHVTVEDLSIRSVEGNGVVMPRSGVSYNRLRRLEMSGLGGYPFRVGGGDFLTQTPGHCVVEDSRFSHFGLNRSGRSFIGGVGNQIRHCEFTHSTDGAIGLQGNDLVIEFSRFGHLNQEGSDAGAVYCGRNPADAGIRIHANYFHDIGNHLDNVTGIQGVYVDDRSGFVEVTRNIFNRVGSGVHRSAFKVNGGKHNRFHENLVINGRAAFIQVHHPESWSAWYESRPIADKLERVDASNPDSQWAQKYPEAYRAAQDKEQPHTSTNVLEGNIIIRGELVAGIIQSRYGDPLPLKKDNHLVETDATFESIDSLSDLKIGEETLATKFPAFPQIDPARIGVRQETKKKVGQ